RTCQTRSRGSGFCANHRAVQTMTFDFHPEAETEFLEAIAYYEKLHTGPGRRFLSGSWDVLPVLLVF
ncbi:MAG: hypothetical protein Q7J12_04965, partial [Syntrophales bacterium]|nr:hypothetical protein [Syntrophales bacterium]